MMKHDYHYLKQAVRSYAVLQFLVLTITFTWAYSQDKFSFTLMDEPLEKLFQVIQEQTDYQFIYNNEDLANAPRISIRAVNMAIEEVLRESFKNTALEYRMRNHTIVVSRMSKPPQREIIGRITDDQGKTLVGATISAKGTSVVSKSNETGYYRITVPMDAKVLVFSMVGYTAIEQELGASAVVNVALSASVSDLDEVVIVGYGTQKKVNVIGSVSQVNSEDIENRPVTQVTHALTGQMPGVTVRVASGRPGSNGGTIRVRGVGSFGAVPDALVLIDGIPGSLNEINPDDIQSVSVLKDASSAAIYGARSANGVILVTTKAGSASQLAISYNGYVGFNEATELPDFANSWEYAEMYNVASGSNSYTPEDIDNFRSQRDPDNFPNTHFLNHLFSNRGLQNGHTLNLNGAGEKVKYFLSGGYLNQDGIIPKNNYERYNVRLNLESDLGSNFKLTTRLAGAFEERNEPQATANRGGELTDQLIQQAVRYPAVYLGQASNGDFGIGPESSGTPVSWLASASYLRNPRNRINANAKLDWTPIEGLNFSAIGGYNFTLLEQHSYRASQRLNADLTLVQSNLDKFRNKSMFKTMQFLGEYGKAFGKNNLDFLIGYSFENEINDNFSGYRQDFPSNDYTEIGMGGADNQQVDGAVSEWAIQSLFARLKYNRSDRYLFESTVRYDGSSRFPDDNKYALFPSLAVGWRLSEEDFLKSVTWLSNLKLKASWGILGNQNLGGDYPYQIVLNSGRNYPFGNSMSTGAAYWTYKDANIRWESTETTDVGIESEFFGGKLGLNATYFNRNTSDILFIPAASVSSVLGVGISETNTGKARNTGWEFDAYYRGNINDFTYSIGGNLSIINNKVLTLGLGNVQQPNGMVGNGSNLFIGYPMQMYYGYLTDGVFLDDTDIAEWPTQTAVTPQPQAGDLRYRDISGPDGVPDGKVDPTHDRTYLGSQIPKYTFGVNLGLNYKGIDFSAFLQGVSGVSGQLTGYAGLAFFNLGNIQRWQMEGRFNPDHPVRYPEYPRLEVVSNSGTPNTGLSDFWVLNAAYLRVKNVQLGYTFPKQLLNAARIDRIRLYVSVENPVTWSSYRQGWDPEISTGGSYYPILSTYTLGCNIKF